MKKAISLALVLAMLLSVFALSAAVVSADAGGAVPKSGCRF